MVIRAVVAGLKLQEPRAEVRAPRDRSLQVGVEAFLVRFCIVRRAGGRAGGRAGTRGAGTARAK